MSLKSIAAKETTIPPETKEQHWVNPEEIKDEIEKWLANYSAKRAAETAMKECEETIIKYATKKWSEICTKIGKAISTITIGGLNVIFQGGANFLKPSTIDENKLRNAFPMEFNTYFKTVDGPVCISPEALEDPEIEGEIAAFFEYMHDKHGRKFLYYQSKIIPTPELARDYHRDDLKIRGKLESVNAERSSPILQPK